MYQASQSTARLLSVKPLCDMNIIVTYSLIDQPGVTRAGLVIPH
jgi:hypothetical protein